MSGSRRKININNIKVNNISKNELIDIFKARNANKEYNDLTSNINILDTPKRMQTKHLSKKVTRNIDKFLNTINGKKFDNEKLIYNKDITGSRKFSKINAREFQINTNHYPHNQSKELFERLLLGLINVSHLGDSWYIECKIKNERIKFNKDIIGTFNRKFTKINAREFEINTSHFTHNQYKELFERLLLGLINVSHLGDTWYIEYSIKGEEDSRYQRLSSMNEDKLKIYQC
jgi:hypothetical protein